MQDIHKAVIMHHLKNKAYQKRNYCRYKGYPNGGNSIRRFIERHKIKHAAENYAGYYFEDKSQGKVSIWYFFVFVTKFFYQLFVCLWKYYFNFSHINSPMFFCFFLYNMYKLSFAKKISIFNISMLEIRLIYILPYKFPINHQKHLYRRKIIL